MTFPPEAKSSSPAALGLALGALGVVFGDIGTSPLYAFRECLMNLPPVDRTEGILGALSLIFWALVAVVNVKYVAFITRADNRGEGGIFALLALSSPDRRKTAMSALTFIVLAGAALLYGDGIITPAMSVLGATEGFESFNPEFHPFVVPLTCVILAGLFLFQSKGTKTLGGVFGPAMVGWFVVLAVLGSIHIFMAPSVLKAINPMHGIRLLIDFPWAATKLLGSVVLVITGAEALYADMGHFGRKAIGRAWYYAAFPGLILNYFGQGAWALSNPDSKANPFFALAPEGFAQLALTGLSLVAAVIASQSMITGTFSITRQAIQLGYFPRLLVRHTNPDLAGQIYLPLVNMALAIGSISVVIGFGSSSALAGAYGIAVTGTMVVTSIVFFLVVRQLWRWSAWAAGALCGMFLLVDLPFFYSNFHKLHEGGWFPLAVAFVAVAIMHTWKKGKMEIFARVYANEITETELREIAKSPHIVRVRGTAVFMAGNQTGTPLVLLHHLKANKVLHKNIVLLTILTEDVPSVADIDRLQVREIGEGIWRAIGHYGYMESPDVGALMDRVRAADVPVKPGEAVYYFNHEMIITGGTARMWRWQKALYAWMSRNARPARDYYRIEPSQIIEVGLPVVL